MSSRRSARIRCQIKCKLLRTPSHSNLQPNRNGRSRSLTRPMCLQESALAPLIAVLVSKEPGTFSIKNRCWCNSKTACGSLPICSTGSGRTNFPLRHPCRRLRSPMPCLSLILLRFAPTTTTDLMSTVIELWSASCRRREHQGSLLSASTECNASSAFSTRRRSRPSRAHKNQQSLPSLPNESKRLLLRPKQRARGALPKKPRKKKVWSNKCYLKIVSSKFEGASSSTKAKNIRQHSRN